MSFCWQDYLEISEYLLKQAPNSSTPEAYRRTAISRAYYAAFISCRNYLRDRKDCTIPKSGKAHTIVPKELGKYNMKQVGVSLTRLKADRRKADYEDQLKNAESMAKSSVSICKSILFELPL